MSKRDGNFSSSEIWRLTKSGKGKDYYFGEPALTYIEDKKTESRLGLPLSTEHNAHSTNWGKLVEGIAFDKMPLDYQLVSKKRYVHPTIKRWTGMPDVVTSDLAGDIKSCWTRKAFCKLVDAMKEGPEAVKNQNGPKDYGYKYYYQIVSNCILTGKSKGGLFVYCPYQSDLKTIRESAAGWDGSENMDFISYLNDDQLPYLIEGNHYQDLNELIFDIPQEDIDFLTERVEEAVKLL